MKEIYAIGEHKDTTIYWIYEKGKSLYMHGLNPLDIFNTLDECLYDIDEILTCTYKPLCKGGMINETGRI